MIQNFKTIELESSFDYPELNQYGNLQKGLNQGHDPKEGCNTPNPPKNAEKTLLILISMYQC